MIHRFGSTPVSLLLRFAASAVLGLVLSAGVAEAQRPVPVKPLAPASQSQSLREQVVPPAFFPPPGLARIWSNRPPGGHDPLQSDRQSAVTNGPANGRVLFGDDPPKT